MGSITEDGDVRIVDEGVPASQRTMSIAKVFWSHFSPNFSPPTWLIGLLIAAGGLDLEWGIIAILAGNVFGSLPTAVSALMGPRTGLTQIENSRFSFGRVGTRLPAALNTLMCVGWVAVGNVPATLAIVQSSDLLHRAVPFWWGLVGLSIVQLAAAVYGHHLVQILEQYAGYVLVVAFGAMVAAAYAHGTFTAPAHHGFSISTFAFAISIAGSNALSWAPYSSDYTRYVSPATSSRRVFWYVFLGLAGSGIAMEAVGFLTAERFTDTSPAGFVAGVATLSGSFAPVVLLVIALSAVTSAAINTTTASYSLISSGFKVPRPISAALVGLAAYALTIVGQGRFTEAYESYLLLLLYWVSPWSGIVLANWYVSHGHRQSRVPRWGSGALVFALVTPLTILLFSSTELYTGPIARALGGLDIGYLVGFVAAACISLALSGPPVRRAQSGEAGGP